MKKQHPGYRRSVEIYFVLYLAALVLLLPDNNSGTTPGSSLISALLEINFAISPEKNVLNCQLSADSSVASILLLDSVNMLYATGNVRDVHYEFEIEDHTIQQRLRLDTRTMSSTSIFRASEETQQGTARFLWHPDMSERRNRTFTVHVKATARPLIPANLRDESMREQLRQIIDREGTTLTATTEFTINILVADNRRFAQGGRIDTMVINTVSPQVPSSQIITNISDFQISAMQSTLDATPNQTWSNRVQLYGATAKDIEPPGIFSFSDDKSGTAVIDKTEGSTITLSGKAPKSGTMAVRVFTKRSADKKTAETQFTVVSKSIPEPHLPSFMYAGQAYLFEPNLPPLVGQETKAILYDNNRPRYVSQQGEKFYFKPELTDTGKSFRFVRSINGEQVDAMYTVKVSDYPFPQVITIEKQGDVLIVTTRSYGTYDNRPNRVRLIVEGSENLQRPTELNGQYLYDTKTQSHTQMFEIRLKDPSRAFFVTVHAEDMRERKSKTESYR